MIKEDLLFEWSLFNLCGHSRQFDNMQPAFVIYSLEVVDNFGQHHTGTHTNSQKMTNLSMFSESRYQKAT